MTFSDEALAAPALPWLAAEQPRWQRRALVVSVHLAGVSMPVRLVTALGMLLYVPLLLERLSINQDARLQ